METETFSKHNQPLGRYLSQLFSHFEQDLMAGIHSQGEFSSITLADHQILRFIGESGSSVVEIAKRAGITKQAVSKAIRSLEGRGFLSRTPHGQDSRSYIFTFTAKGRRLFKEGIKTATRIEKNYQKVIGSQDLEKLKVLMQRLIENHENTKEVE